MLRHPFTFGRGFDQNPCMWAPPEECGQSITRRANALIDNLAALRQDSHLAFFLVQVDGTMLHGWSPLLRLRARLRSVEPKLPPTKEASRFIVSVSHTRTQRGIPVPLKPLIVRRPTARSTPS
jgi:hypothetical protein